MIALRLDADHARGMGHLFRMRTLASALAREGVESVVVVRENPVAEALLRQWGLLAVMVPAQTPETEIPALARAAHPHLAGWVFDVLETRPEWIASAKSLGLGVVVFDDAGPGARQADQRINPIVGCWPHRAAGAALEGPAYALLDERLATLRQQTRPQDGPPVLGISLGGSDTHGATLGMAAWAAGESALRCTVFTGPHFEHGRELEDLLATHGRRLGWRRNVPDLPAELASLDALVCAGGQTLFEAAALGLPVLAVANEPHERWTIDYFVSRGAARTAGEAKAPDIPALRDFALAVEREDPAIRDLGRAAAGLVDGRGARRCARACIKAMQGRD